MAVMRSEGFEAKKKEILHQLNLPDDEYNDLSPKGSLDEGIRDLVGKINAIDGLVTTSSCAGRVSIFLEGSKKGSQTVFAQSSVDSDERPSFAGPGGKGGGRWFFVSHEPVQVENEPKQERSSYLSLFGLQHSSNKLLPSSLVSRRLVHLKFEAMVCYYSVSIATLQADTDADSPHYGA